MKRALHILLCIGALLSAQRGAAQGDLCNNATAIACGAVVNGNTTPFTVDVAPFCFAGDGTAGGVWYRFGGTGGSITASLCGSAFDTRIRIFNGNCAAPVCVAGNEDFCGLQSQVTWLSALGTTYYILINGFGAAVGPYTLSITCAAPPTPMCYSQTTVPYIADPYTGTMLTMSDDVHSAVVNIGFNFCYNGTTYSQCVISSNNYVTFNLANAGTYSPWPTVVVPTLTPAQISNSILNPWQDLYPPAGGTIAYQTLGVAPNRRFVVSYLNVSMFSCTTQRYTSQTVLYEGSNCIGSFIFEKNVCAAWNGGNAVHALHNNGGTSAAVVPGRNNTQWTATAQGLLFSPTCVPCSTAATTACLSLVLPIELLHFRGSNAGAVNILEWATASEQNSDHFTVERSANGEDFEAVLEVDAAGQSNAVIDYMLKDEAPLHGVNYYRLRTTDVDGSEEFSDAIAVRNEHGNGLLVFPNPAHGNVQVRLPEGLPLPATLIVRDLSGRVVRVLPVESAGEPLDINDLAIGSYFLELPITGQASTVRFVIE